MKQHCPRPFCLLPLALLLALTLASQATAAPYWVGSWAASPAPAPAATVGADGSSTSFASAYQNETVREIVRLTDGGDQIRVRLTNRYGASPLTIGAATVALRAQGSTISPDTLQPLTFDQQTTVTIPPGADVLSDAVSLAVAPQAELAVSLYIPGTSPTPTIHIQQRSAIYTALEDQTKAASFPPSDSTADARPWVWLDGVDVTAFNPAPVVVTFGDSITDGAQLSRDNASEWPTILSQRMQQEHKPGAVLNAGLSGNRILHDGQWTPFGVNGLTRFDSDVLAQSGVRDVIVLLGINDIGQAAPDSPEKVTAEQIEWGLTQFAERAHAHGLKIYIGTLTPFADTTYKGVYSPEKEQEREAVNTWIRQQGRYDGVIDFDKTLRDPAHPTHLLPAYDSGDHLHPGDAGARAMADAIPLGLLR